MAHGRTAGRWMGLGQALAWRSRALTLQALANPALKLAAADK